MNPIDRIEALFLQTFNDKVLSKAERQELQIAIAEAGLDQRKRDILRSKVFEIASASAGASNMFTMDWLEAATRLLEARETHAEKTVGGSLVYFSPGDDCLNAILSQVRSATRTVDICVFTISDDRISDALIAQHRKGIKLRILTDNEKLLDAGSDIERLYKAGIEIRVDMTEYHMHHKFMVVDGKVALTGSYNWTRSAAAYNEENILVTSESGVVRRYAEEFGKMWEKMDVFG